jgi:hypothetical protein
VHAITNTGVEAIVMHLYSVTYLPDEMSTPGSLPALRIITKGIFSASAIGGPKMKPRASKPAMCVGPASPAAR